MKLVLIRITSMPTMPRPERSETTRAWYFPVAASHAVHVSPSATTKLRNITAASAMNSNAEPQTAVIFRRLIVRRSYPIARAADVR